MNKVQGSTYARVSLIGNPSDIYGGRAIALPIRNFRALVIIEPSNRVELVGREAVCVYPSLQEMLPSLRAIDADDGGIRLFQAAIKRFFYNWPEFSRASSSGDARHLFRMTYETTVPYRVGLAGSSAIVIATLRALMQWFGVATEPAHLAELALTAELEDLGTRAGPLDRIIQSYEQVLHMDYRLPRTSASYTPIDPSSLPPVFVAWDPSGEKYSGKVHNDVWLRWQNGDADVRRAIEVFPILTDKAMICLQKRDVPGLQKLVDQNFDTRASIFDISSRDQEMVAIGRSFGAALNCGSGGSVIGVMRDDALYSEIERALTEEGFKVIRPLI
jgi:glucuronokinase